MIVTSPPQTYDITSITGEERDLLRVALVGLAKKLQADIGNNEALADAGVSVEPFLTSYRRELASVNRMIDMLYGT